jgi:hypothetical protein
VDPSRGSASLGRAIANTRLYVLDGNMEPVPIGVPGELYIGGRGVTRGYLNRESLTAERYVADRFTGERGARLYRTGDQVRWASDGTLEYCGRLDQQVKVRGHRIELAEIEAVLCEEESVQSCVVVVHGEGVASRLVAYYVADPPKAGGAPRSGIADVGDLRSVARAKLPEHMVPSAFVRLETLPQTPNGKVDRKALMEREAPGLGPVSAKPGTNLERDLGEIWKEILQIEVVDIHRTFFEHGGTSLQLVRVQRHIRIKLGIELAVAELFGNATLKSLAAFVGRRNDRDYAPEQQQGENDKGGVGVLDERPRAIKSSGAGLSDEDLRAALRDEFDALHRDGEEADDAAFGS